MKFTTAKIKSLKSKEARYEVWEDGRKGFGIRVSTTGFKSWLYMFWFEGGKQRMTLGSYPKMSLANAHTVHAQAVETKDNGFNPAKMKVVANKEERDAATIKSLTEDYLKLIEGKKKTAPEIKRTINKDILPMWKRRKIKSINKTDVTSLLNGIKNRGAPIQANRVQALLHRMFNWAISEGNLESNPCSGVEKRGTETERDRVLSNYEVKLFWANLPACTFAQEIKLALKFQLVTVQRKGEIVKAKRGDIDLDAKIWTIPAGNTKNALAHRVPLSDLAIDIIKEAIALHNNSKWIFTSPVYLNKDEPIRARSVDHAMKNNLDTLGLENVRPHDLRRTGASNIASLGIPRFTLSRVLNHKDRGPTAVYDRHGYDAEKKHALDLWASKLKEIIEGEKTSDNVVQLNR